ncbi:MAG: hypothetical protein HY833_03135 [Candidatus Aenigmarchaeota archaeon]|nr:hypothetical protein [Candidatus Aenigmarchaeota archaeon]
MSPKKNGTKSAGEFFRKLRPLLESSDQPMYVYLDDDRRVCNKKFASLLGYKSAREWSSVKGSFPMVFVDGASRHTLVSAYRSSVGEKTGSSIRVTWNTKNNKKVKTNVIMVPVTYKKMTFALHFVSKM